jgi:polysaccharide biosynthesis transport protein
MATLLAELTEQFEMVLIDAPPVLPVADALIIGRQTDGALFVCSAGRARRAEIKKALASLSKVDVRVLGTVASMIPRRSLQGYGYGAYTSAPAAAPVAAVAS